jgi:hypothetical protein
LSIVFGFIKLKEIWVQFKEGIGLFEVFIFATFLLLFIFLVFVYFLN